jgi:hypothetical protein
MYIFVLLYTPAVESVMASDTEISLGYLFSTMMVAIMVGSMCFQLFERQSKSGPRCFLHFKEDRLLSMALGLASCAFMLMSYFGDSSVSVCALWCRVFFFLLI